MRSVIGYLIILIFFLVSCGEKVHAQKDVKYSESNKVEIANDTTIYIVVEKMPVFCEKENLKNKADGSSFQFLQYIYKHLEYKKFKKGDEIPTMILVSFVIEKDGSTSNLKLLKGDGVSNLKEVIEEMPAWIPGENRGAEKRVKMRLPIRIHFQ